MFMTPSPQDSKPSVHQVMSATAATEEFSPDELDQALADEVSQFYADPLGFVMWAFDWSHGELEGFEDRKSVV